MRRILCLHLPDWPIQRLLAANRELDPRQPIILHTRDPRRGQVIAACNQVAGNCGVRVGMPLAEAASLTTHSTKIKGSGIGGRRASTKDAARPPKIPEPLPHDPAADLTALADLAEHCERFSPIVGWETIEPGEKPGGKSNEMHPPSSLLLDVTGIGALFGSEEKLIHQVIADLAERGYSARIAIAETIGAAWAATREEQSPPSAISNPQSAISHLRLPQETLDLLGHLGIQRIDQLIDLPRSSLRARFGERLLLRLDQFTGAAAETIVAHRPPPQFAAEWVLEYPAERREVVEQIVHDLVVRVGAALAQRREGVVRLCCRLDCAPGRPVMLEVGLFRPSADARHLWELVQMQLEQALLPGPVGRITLEAAITAPLENRQGELFSGSFREASRQLGLLIDRLSSRLGPQAVLHAQPTADPLPERAVRYVAAVAGNQRPVSKSKKPVATRKKKRSPSGLALAESRPRVVDIASDHRPLTLHAPPLVLEVISVVPDGPPMSFRFQGRTHRVAHYSGPERIETGWWRGSSVRRDYYRVETASGQRFWLFRCLEDGRWCLHGEFE